MSAKYVIYKEGREWPSFIVTTANFSFFAIDNIDRGTRFEKEDAEKFITEYLPGGVWKIHDTATPLRIVRETDEEDSDEE